MLVDGVTTASPGGNFGRPSINDLMARSRSGIVSTSRVPGEGIFAGRAGVFRTLGPTDRLYNGAGDRGDANNNDAGIGAFESRSSNENGEFVTALATSNDGVLSIVADTLNGYAASASTRRRSTTAARSHSGDSCADFTTDGVFTGPNPKKDAIITSRDRLDGARIISGSFSVCSEALNNAGEIVFIVDLVDNPQLEGFRTAIYVASPKKAASL